MTRGFVVSWRCGRGTQLLSRGGGETGALRCRGRGGGCGSIGVAAAVWVSARGSAGGPSWGVGLVGVVLGAVEGSGRGASAGAG